MTMKIIAISYKQLQIMTNYFPKPCMPFNFNCKGMEKASRYTDSMNQDAFSHQSSCSYAALTVLPSVPLVTM